MKFGLLVSTTAAGLLAGLAITVSVPAQEESMRGEPARYIVRDLGPAGAPLSEAYLITSNGLVGGAAANSDGTMHAVLWYNALLKDITKHSLGGPNSAAFSVNEIGRAVGQAETSDADDEDFCGFNFLGFPSETACLPFLWEGGAMTKLPTLGGANGFANSINTRGEVAGLAETTMTDPTPGCPVHQFEPVIWKNGLVKALPTYPGDPDGVAAFINDMGQVVGASGTCTSFNSSSGLYLVEDHALLWDHDSVTDLGNLGGTGGMAGNHACAINNRGQVVGHSELANDTTFHGFLWTSEAGKMLDLGTLPGDYASLGLGINDRGEVVGASLDPNFSPRAIVWKNGVMADLNTLIPADAPLYLLLAISINDAGEIVGQAVQKSTGDVHAFLASPARPGSR
jgi:probable HAF family extracellular repeat protein